MSTPFERYPRWARTLAHGIRARLGNTFLLHGNTHDLVPVPTAAEAAPGATAGAATGTAPAAPAPAFLPLTPFLAEWIFGQRDVVIEYQRANGAVSAGVGTGTKSCVLPCSRKVLPSRARMPWASVRAQPG